LRSKSWQSFLSNLTRDIEKASGIGRQVSGVQRLISPFEEPVPLRREGWGDVRKVKGVNT
jgi:hypothetical protein